MIGIFDSGSGGLTVLRAIRARVPSCDVVYFGDIKHAPYGARDHAELSRLTIDAMMLLRARGASAIVSACNSVSATLALSVFDTVDIHPAQVIEMVGPTVAKLRHMNAPLLICATEATLRAGLYQNAFRLVGKEVRVVSIPALAGAIEKGSTSEEITNIITNAFSAYTLTCKHVVVLACTHYPLAEAEFRKVLPQHIQLFDPAYAVAERVEERWWPREVGNGTTTFLISEDSDVFRARVEQLLPDGQYTVEVIQSLHA